MSDNENETEIDDERLSDDQEIWAKNLRDNLEETRDAADEIIPVMEELIDGDITKEEYEEWVDENEETFKGVEI